MSGSKAKATITFGEGGKDRPRWESRRPAVIERLKTLGVSIPESLMDGGHLSRLGVVAPAWAKTRVELEALVGEIPDAKVLSVEQLDALLADLEAR